MHQSLSLDHARDVLAGNVHDRGTDLPRFDPLDIDPYLAMSLMQKAIRRDRVDLALGSAARLIETSPERLWRRLCVTAYEDVGVADLDTVALVTAALTGKGWRSEHGGDWAIASLVIERMCAAVKCRASDDLACVCERHPRLSRARSSLARLPVQQLLDRATTRAALPDRALALWYALGTARCRSDVLPTRKGDPQAALEGLRERGYPENVVELAREGLKKGAEVLAPFLVLLWREMRRSARHAEPDDLPGEEMIGPVPCWAYDMHVRDGNRAMARFLETETETSRWLRDRVPKAQRVRFLGGLLFAIESGLVARRLKWDTGNELRRMAEIECQGLDPEEAALGLRLLRQDLPILNQARRHVAASNLR